MAKASGRDGVVADELEGASITKVDQCSRKLSLYARQISSLFSAQNMSTRSFSVPCGEKLQAHQANGHIKLRCLNSFVVYFLSFPGPFSPSYVDELVTES